MAGTIGSMLMTSPTKPDLICVSPSSALLTSPAMAMAMAPSLRTTVLLLLLLAAAASSQAQAPEDGIRVLSAEKRVRTNEPTSALSLSQI